MSRSRHHTGTRPTKRDIPEGRTVNLIRRGDWDALASRESTTRRRTR